MSQAKRPAEIKEAVEKTYRCNPSAKPFHESTAQVKALWGPVGSGKSLAVIIDQVCLAMESDVPLRAVVLRESYKQLLDSTMKTWNEWFSAISSYKQDSHNLYYTLTNHRGKELTHELHLRHCRKVEQASDFLSTEYGGIWFEEPVPAFQMDTGVIGAGLPEGAFDVALMRQRQAGIHRLHIWLSFNPPSKYHWCDRRILSLDPKELDDLDFAHFWQPPLENSKNLPPNYYRRLEAQLGPDLVKRFVKGERVTIYPHVRVFPAFNEQVHFVDRVEPIPNLPLTIGFDFGRTPVALIGQRLPNGRVVELREVQLWNAGAEDLAEELTRVLAEEFPRHREWACWGDPSGSDPQQTDEKTCYQILSQAGFKVIPGARDWQSRFEAVHQRCTRMIDGKPAILVSRYGCPLLTEGLLGGYQFPKYSSGLVGPRPFKNDFSHVCDALQYKMTGLFSVIRAQEERPMPKTKRPFDPLSTAKDRPHHGRTWMSG